MGRITEEIISDESTRRFQQNSIREFNRSENRGITVGSLSGSMANNVQIKENTWRVPHFLKKEPVGFVLISHNASEGVVASISNQTTESLDIFFDVKSGQTSPTSFVIFIY